MTHNECFMSMESQRKFDRKIRVEVEEQRKRFEVQFT
jgi:hypothetical protein